jgi:DNA-binding NtrC family response regulator
MLKTLAYFDNNKLKAAEALGISAKTIYNHLARYKNEEEPQTLAKNAGET